MADRMGIELQRQFHITAAKQCLHGFRICSGPNQERRQTMAKVVKPNRRGSSSTIRPFSSRCEEKIPAFAAAGRQVVFDRHVGYPRLFALRPE